MIKNAGFKISLLGFIIAPMFVATANAQRKPKAKLQTQKIKQSTNLSINDYMELATRRVPNWLGLD